MDVREKMVELLFSSLCRHIDKSCKLAENIADDLISNGVTVQEWVSVDDRLPEDGDVVIICTNKNFVYAGELIGDTWFLDNDSWTADVTHWMPLPQPAE